MGLIKKELNRLSKLNSKMRIAEDNLYTGLSDSLLTHIGIEELIERIDIKRKYNDPITSILGVQGYILELRYLEGLSVEDIQAITGLSKGYIYKNIRDSIKHLRILKS